MAEIVIKRNETKCGLLTYSFSDNTLRLNTSHLSFHSFVNVTEETFELLLDELITTTISDKDIKFLPPVYIASIKTLCLHFNITCEEEVVFKNLPEYTWVEEDVIDNNTGEVLLSKGETLIKEDMYKLHQHLTNCYSVDEFESVVEWLSQIFY